MADFTLKDGTLLRGGTYRIVRFISAGGFGCTYEAVHTGLNHRVAIKEFFVRDFCNRDPLTSRVVVSTDSKKELEAKLQRKFLDEARAVFHLNHPGIVRVSDVFEENGTAYFVMDYVEGESLAEIIKRRGSLPEDEALRYIREVADALAYVHGTKRLHLDIKPANIMVDGNGKTTLIDFGVSKQYDEANGENTSTLLGRTAGYAPIEQMSPKLRKFTPATDIYALAATLYKALTGVTPPDSIDLHITEELSFPNGISATTIGAIESAMRQKAADRPQSIADFLSILDAPAASAKTATESPSSSAKTTTGSTSSSVKTATVNPSSEETVIVPRASSANPQPPLPVGSEFTSGKLKFTVTAKGKVKVSRQSDNISGKIAIPAKVTHIAFTYDVTAIGESAFEGCLSLTSVTIPNSVTEIGKWAFDRCSSLTSVTIPNSVTEIGDRAFVSCSSLTSVTIPNSVTEIGKWAFEGCSSLTSVTIPNSVTEIGESAFAWCSSLTSVTIPNSVTEIGKWAFEGCSSLTSVTIPNSVTEIGESAFEGCSSLTSVTIPNSVTEIGESAFAGCSSLTSVTIPNSVTEIGESAFASCSSLTSVTIPNSVTEIGESAFAWCSSLTSVTIPNSVTEIGESAFEGCSSLTSVTIPNSVTEIGKWAFDRCSSLTSVTIPNSVTKIGDRAFNGCSSLKSINIENPNCEIGITAFSDTLFFEDKKIAKWILAIHAVVIVVVVLAVVLLQ